ncbi:MAG: hypothetical protein OXT09_08005 [Myxococcales bacterium]|nr:hypothetical protein [Myxococcales bacterium]
MSQAPAGGPGKRLYCEIDGIEVVLDVTDLSPAGLFVQTTTMLEADSEVEVFLRTPIGQMSVQAVVVQTVTYERAASEGRKPGFGLLFSGLTGEQSALVARSLCELASKPAPKPPRKATGAKAKAARKAARAAAGAASPRPRMDPEARQTLKHLERELDSVRSGSPWAILGIDSGSHAEKAREAYFTASKRYHPHKYARFDSDEITSVVTEIFIAHKRAYATIMRTSVQPLAGSEPGRPSGLNGKAQDRVTSIRPRRQQSDVVSLVKEGMRCLAASRFADAEACFARALDKKEDEQQAALWLQLCRARKAKAEGRGDDAIKHYQSALKLDPSNKEAQEGAAASSKKGRLFGRLFKAESG